MRSSKFLIMLVFATILSCKKELPEYQINGLWLVKKVTMGNEEMITPALNWMQFNTDSTHAFGNGWLQNSFGSWTFQKKSKILTIKNDIGFSDYTNPMKIALSEKNMTCKLKVDEMEITVFFERIDKLPTSEANKLYGLWKIDSTFINSKDVSDSLNPDKKAMLFLRWDNNFEIRNYPEGEKYGIFKTQAFRQQLEMVNYSRRSPKFQFYDFIVDDEKLQLKSKDEKTVLKLSRIDQFLK